MAYSISEAANLVLTLLDNAGVGIDSEERNRLSKRGDAIISGFRCKLANVLTLNSARILVNTSWFDPKNPNYAKPRMRQGTDNPGIVYQLIPTDKKLFSVHYLDLRHYALYLEKDREHWFSQSYWGIQVYEEKNVFTWTGGNILEFPLLHLTSSHVLLQRDKDIFESMKRE